MCGIFAQINIREKPVDLTNCRRATHVLAHRGPDSWGENYTDNRDVYFGHRRLAILDLSVSGNQPFSDAQGNLLIYNGELYNFQNIKKQLESTGIVFKSNCDTEVIFHALNTWGLNCIHKFEGMFALVYWDAVHKKALAIRDPLGIKPLYYWANPEGIAISSELKSFYYLDEFQPEFNIKTLPEFLRFRSIIGRDTLLKNVYELGPGEYLIFNQNENAYKIEEYWRPESCLTPFSPSDSDSFSMKFNRIVQQHLIADVPVGARFSGGLDSSLIACIMQKDLSTELMGFHCHVKNASYDETPFARQIAQHLGFQLVTETLDAETFFSDLIEKLTYHLDEPLTHPNSIGIFLISQKAKDLVKVLLSGEAADELFCGYSRYIVVNQFSNLQRLGYSFCSKLLSMLYPGLGHHQPITLNDFILLSSAYLSDSDLNAFLSDNSAANASNRNRQVLLQGLSIEDNLTRCQVYDIKTYLPALFVRQDKMSMAASIENRVPFATPEMVAYALSLSNKQKVTLVARKRVLRETLKSYLPNNLISRKKWGFGIPLMAWFQTKQGKERIATLRDTSSKLSNYIDVIHYLMKSNSPTTAYDANVIWTLLTLNIWFEIFLEKTKFHREHQVNLGDYPA